jgi:hypothetical protein
VNHKEVNKLNESYSMIFNVATIYFVCELNLIRGSNYNVHF